LFEVPVPEELHSLVFWVPTRIYPPPLNKRLLLGWKPTLGAPPVARFTPREELFHLWEWEPDPWGDDPDLMVESCSCPLGQDCEAPRGSLYRVIEEEWTLYSGRPVLETGASDGLVLVWEGEVCRVGVEHARWFLKEQIRPNQWSDPSGVLEIADRLRDFFPEGKIVVNGQVL
jgi:hypothetical protein